MAGKGEETEVDRTSRGDHRQQRQRRNTGRETMRMHGSKFSKMTSRTGITRRTAVGTALAAAALLSSANTATAIDRDESIRGTLSIGIVASQMDNFETIIKGYMAVRPNVKVELTSLAPDSNSLLTALATRALSGRIPDIVQTFDRFPRPYADRGISASLNEYLAEGKVKRSDFADRFINQYEVIGGPSAGQVHGMPMTADAVVLYYNKDAFDKAGVPYPTPDWEWSDLVDAARKLTVKSGNNTVQYGFGGFYAWHATYVPAIKAFGGTFFKDGRVHLRTEAASKAFRAYLDNVKDGIFATPAVIRTAGTWDIGFATELYAMASLVRAQLPNVLNQARPGLRFDIQLMPKFNGVRANGMGSFGIALSSQGVANKKIAYDFFDYFYNGDGGMKVLTAKYGVVPPVKALFDSPVWRNLPRNPANSDAYIKAMEFGEQNPGAIPGPAQGIIDQTMTAMIESVIIGGKSVEDALATAEATINDYLQKNP
jgi:multiple sugar transport system substrate-binding protein